MSVDLIVYLRRAAMPSPAGWQRAIRDAGFPVELDHDFDPDTFTGFLPCRFRGAVSGFEYYGRRLTHADRAAVGAPAGADFQVTLVTHADVREFACSVAAASSLCRASGGELYNPQAGESFPADRVLVWAADVFSGAEREVE